MVDHYRLIRPLPPILNYLAASYALEIVQQRHDTIPMNEWVFRARKLNAGTVCVLLSAIGERTRLLEQLADGFDVEPGTPAGKIMERLVREGVAEKARPGRRR